jgi:hypothetical protein
MDIALRNQLVDTSVACSSGQGLPTIGKKKVRCDSSSDLCRGCGGLIRTESEHERKQPEIKEKESNCE